MPRKNFPTLILEDRNGFRDQVGLVASELGKVWETKDAQEALELLTVQPFRLLLLDWHLMKYDLPAFGRLIDSLQPGAIRLALFHTPQLPQVLSAMKWGMMDALWDAQGVPEIRKTIAEALARQKKDAHGTNTVTQLAETLVDRAVGHKMSLFKARKDFSKAFLTQMLNRKGVQRNQLADVMKVSSRTLQRYLSN
jgi:DNA-binding NtrC family response regulator